MKLDTTEAVLEWARESEWRDDTETAARLAKAMRVLAIVEGFVFGEHGDWERDVSRFIKLVDEASAEQKDGK